MIDVSVCFMPTLNNLLLIGVNSMFICAAQCFLYVRHNVLMQTNEELSSYTQMERVHFALMRTGATSRRSITEVAKLLKETPQTIKNWDVRGPSAAGILKIQRILGISATWVLYGEGPMLVGETAPAPAFPPSSKWPFPDIPFSKWEALSERAKGKVETMLLQLIDEELKKAQGQAPEQTGRAA